MNNEMAPEHAQSPPPFETFNTTTQESQAEEQPIAKATPAAESTASPTPSKSRGQKTPLGMMQFSEHYRVTRTINKFLISEKASVVATQDRVEKLYQLREECIATAEKEGKGSLRENFPSQMNEDEERTLVVKHFSEYISGFKAPVEGNRSVGLMRSQTLRQDHTRSEEVNKDDPEPEPVRRRVKGEVKEGSRDSLAAMSKMPKSGVVAGMTITRGFRDARLAVGSKSKTSAERIWKQIGGKWTPLPSFSLKAAESGFAKRKLESVDPEIEGKKVKLEAEV